MVVPLTDTPLSIPALRLESSGSNMMASTDPEPAVSENGQDISTKSNPIMARNILNSESDSVMGRNHDQGGFRGWMTTSAESPMTYQTFTPKPWEETDVDIAITHCGVCASDIHTMHSGWGETLYPCCLGHEIVGTAVRVGRNARPGIKVGSRVGVGPQCYTCRSLTCTSCSISRENYCPRRVATYGDRYPNGSISYGGFANKCRHNSYSVYNIPNGLTSEDAAVMLCAGATVYEPLVECLEHPPGVRQPGKGFAVGIVGLGGLGHLGVLFSTALGFEHIIAISRSQTKRADALALGAHSYIATSDEDGWAEKHESSLDLVICTVSSPQIPFKEYLGLLKPRGRFCQVGIPEWPLPQLDVMALVLKGTSICFSDSANPANVREMLELAARLGIRAWTQIRGMDEVNEVVGEMKRGQARFRFVLENKGED